MSPLKFAKMSGAGNDFVVIGGEASRTLGEDLPSWTRRVCRRGLSVGADGVLVVEPIEGGRVAVRFLNPDGTETFCGNGTRCAARFARLRGMASESMTLRTCRGEIPARVSGDSVRLTLPAPKDRGEIRLEQGDRVALGRRFDALVPHFVTWVDDLSAAPLEILGPWIRHHPAFAPDGTNVDLVAFRPDGSLGIRTWERGVENETLACGSGALAAAAFVRSAAASPRLRVVPASGVVLVVEFAATERETEVILEGDARLVFEGLLLDEGVSGFPSC